MKYTSAEAAKLLKKLNEQYTALLSKETRSRQFFAALGEDIESVRPEYNFKEIQQQLEEIKRQIRIVKHAINVFNCTHKVPGFDMTVDEMLVYIPQLTSDKNRLYMMKEAMPKVRTHVSGAGKSNVVIDYMYANYDIKEAEDEYHRVSELLAKAQLALDTLNNTENMEIEF